MSELIDGVKILELHQHEDKRGWLMELFRDDELDETDHPVMSYISMTLPGVVRGPHEHVDQTDLFCFAGPSTFRLYLWDAREKSPTKGAKMVVEAGENRPLAVIVPPGVVHAYKNIGPHNGIVYNAPNRHYRGWGRAEPVDEIRHEDRPNSPYIIE